MGYERIKTEHAGAKNGGGAWMTRAEAKQTSKRKRRQQEKRLTRLEQVAAGLTPPGAPAGTTDAYLAETRTPRDLAEIELPDLPVSSRLSEALDAVRDEG